MLGSIAREFDLSNNPHAENDKNELFEQLEVGLPRGLAVKGFSRRRVGWRVGW